MCHITYKRKHFKSINTYNYIIKLITKRNRMCLGNTNATDNGQFKIWSRVTRTITLIPVQRFRHKKFSITHRSNIISKVKVFQKKPSKVMVTVSKMVFSHGLLMWNIKALAFTVQILLAKIKFSENSSNSKVMVIVLKMLLPMERSCHKEYLYEISNSSSHCSKVIIKVN